MFKNVASQKITLLAVDTAANVPKTGDVANLTAYVSIDDGAVTALGDTSATELSSTNAPGLYSFDLTQAETNGDKLVFSGKSSTSDIHLVPVTVYTFPTTGILAPTTAGRTLTVESDGMAHADVKEWGASTTPVTNINTVYNTDFANNYNTTLDSWNVNVTEWAGQTAALASNNLPQVDVSTIVGDSTITSNMQVVFNTDFASNYDTTLDRWNANATHGAGTAWNSGAIEASTLAADALSADKIPDATWQELIELFFSYNATGTYAGATAGSLVKEIADNAGGSALTEAGIADAVWDELLSGHAISGSAGEQLSAAGAAGDPWATALPGAYGSGTAGKIIGDNINATISSRSSHSASDVWAVGTRALTDKAGFTISGTTTTLDALQTSLSLAHGSGSWNTAEGFSTHSAADVWAVATRALTDKAGFTISGTITTLDALDTAQDTQHGTTQTAISALNDIAASDVVTALGTGSTLTALATQASVNTIDDFLDTEIAAIKAKTDNLPASPAATGDIPTVSQIWTTALTEAYRATGATGTAAQLLYELIAHLGNSSIAGTTKTLKKLDTTTTAKTYTLDSDTTPTAIEEAS